MNIYNYTFHNCISFLRAFICLQFSHSPRRMQTILIAIKFDMLQLTGICVVRLINLKKSYGFP